MNQTFLAQPLRHDIIAGMVQQRLENWSAFGVRKFSLQGLGMLRLKMRNGLRLHVWSPQHAWVKDAIAHSHPWDMESYIVCGQLQNQRYQWINPEAAEINMGVASDVQGRPLMKRRLIKCGEGGCAIGDEETGFLIPFGRVETYHAGDIYGQRAEEIHISVATPGTVSIIKRTGDTEQAHVFYENAWDSAEPRYPTVPELQSICEAALQVLEREGHGHYRS